MSPASSTVYTPHAAQEAIIDAEAVAPQGAPCPACGAPVEPGDRFCPACGTPRAAPPAAAAPRNQRIFRCQNCSSEVATDPDQRSYTCPFCDSTYVVEFSPEDTGRQPPEFVIGFAVTPDQALERFHRWIQDNAWFRPGDLQAAQIAEKLKGIYLPFWSFSMFAHSVWQATIGEHWYRTETYTEQDSKGNTVTRTRQVQETEWWPLAGQHQQYHSGYLVSGSRGLKQAEADRVQPFQLPALKRYEPYFLAGWLCEEYSVSRDEALRLCQAEFYRREQANVATFLPGDTHQGLEVQTTFSQASSDLCLLPIYLLSYRYRDKLYRFMVNGQTGKAAGDKPVSWKRIGVALGIAAAILAVLLLVLAGLSR
jgi:DNA-directed RNA polymerase subunit RPC12/RpoP